MKIFNRISLKSKILQALIVIIKIIIYKISLISWLNKFQKMNNNHYNSNQGFKKNYKLKIIVIVKTIKFNSKIILPQ